MPWNKKSNITIEFLISLLVTAVITTVMKTSEAFFDFVNSFGIKSDFAINMLASILGATLGLVMLFVLTRFFKRRE